LRDRGDQENGDRHCKQTHTPAPPPKLQATERCRQVVGDASLSTSTEAFDIVVSKSGSFKK
jgi:hypothetical protein